MTLRLIVCGGRDYHHVSRAVDVLNTIEREFGALDTIVATGGAKGADSLALEWVRQAPDKRSSTIFYAMWRAHGKSAGPIRNQQMLDLFRPDLVVAFPGGAGTADMTRRAEAASVPVRTIAKAT